MAEPSWTPGPWTCGADIGGINHQFIVAPVSSRIVARVDFSGNRTLIAAAPDLYEALSILLQEVKEAGFESATDFNWPIAIAGAAAALAKARGKR